MKSRFYVGCSVALGVLFALVVVIDIIFPLKYYGIIKKYCNSYGVRPSVALAVIWAESKFDASAVSNAGACGLMQLMPSTAEWLCSMTGQKYDYDSLFDAEYNVRLGVYYISYLQNSFSGKYVFAAYNAGEGNVRRWLETNGEIQFAETRNYVKRVSVLTNIYELRISDTP